MAAFVAAVMTAAAAIASAFLMDAFIRKRGRADAPTEPGEAPEALMTSEGSHIFRTGAEAGVGAVAIAVLSAHASGAEVPLWSGGVALLALALAALPRAGVPGPAWLTLPLFLCAATAGLRYETWESDAVISAQAALGPAITSGGSLEVARMALAAFIGLVLAIVWGACYSMPQRVSAGIPTTARAAVCAAPALAAAPIAGPGFPALISGPPVSWSFAAVSIAYLVVVAASGAAANYLVRRAPSSGWIHSFAAVSSMTLILLWLI